MGRIGANHTAGRGEALLENVGVTHRSWGRYSAAGSGGRQQSVLRLLGLHEMPSVGITEEGNTLFSVNVMKTHILIRLLAGSVKLFSRVSKDRFPRPFWRTESLLVTNLP